MAETICHYNFVRMRVIGTGSLLMTYFSLSEVRSVVLTPFTMSTSTNIEPTRLTNFVEQQAKLRCKTTGFGDNFRITRIVLGIKPAVFAEYPM